MSLTIADSVVTADLVVEIANRLFYAGTSEAAVKLLAAHREGRHHVALTIHDREAILSVIDDPPAELVALRGGLLAEQRQLEGLPDTQGMK